MFYVNFIYCNKPYNYDELFKQYHVAQLQAVIDDQYVIDQLSTGEYYFYITYHDSNTKFKVDPHDLTISNQTILVNLENYEQITGNDRGFRYLEIEIAKSVIIEDVEFHRSQNLNCIHVLKVEFVKRK